MSKRTFVTHKYNIDREFAPVTAAGDPQMRAAAFTIAQHFESKIKKLTESEKTDSMSVPEGVHGYNATLERLGRPSGTLGVTLTGAVALETTVKPSLEIEETFHNRGNLALAGAVASVADDPGIASQTADPAVVIGQGAAKRAVESTESKSQISKIAESISEAADYVKNFNADLVQFLDRIDSLNSFVEWFFGNTLDPLVDKINQTVASHLRSGLEHIQITDLGLSVYELLSHAESTDITATKGTLYDSAPSVWDYVQDSDIGSSVYAIISTGLCCVTTKFLRSQGFETMTTEEEQAFAAELEKQFAVWQASFQDFLNNPMFSFLGNLAELTSAVAGVVNLLKLMFENVFILVAYSLIELILGIWLGATWNLLTQYVEQIGPTDDPDVAALVSDIELLKDMENYWRANHLNISDFYLTALSVMRVRINELMSHKTGDPFSEDVCVALNYALAHLLFFSLNETVLKMLTDMLVETFNVKIESSTVTDATGLINEINSFVTEGVEAITAGAQTIMVLTQHLITLSAEMQTLSSNKKISKRQLLARVYNRLCGSLPGFRYVFELGSGYETAENAVQQVREMGDAVKERLSKINAGRTLAQEGSGSSVSPAPSVYPTPPVERSEFAERTSDLRPVLKRLATSDAETFIKKPGKWARNVKNRNQGRDLR